MGLAASGVGVEIDATALPISEAARGWHAGAGTDALMAALAGGDDYELLFTAAPERRGELAALAAELALPLTRIGRLHEGEGIRVIDVDGKGLTVGRAGWTHF